jgi:hypothetical protein
MSRAFVKESAEEAAPPERMGEARFAKGERNGPVDHFEQRTPRAWASGRAKTAGHV